MGQPGFRPLIGPAARLAGRERPWLVDGYRRGWRSMAAVHASGGSAFAAERHRSLRVETAF